MADFIYGDAEIEYLSKKDKKLAAQIARIGKIARPVIPDLFEALVNSIVGQQISMKAADTIWSRLVAQLGAITPQAVCGAEVSQIQSCGLSFRKAGYIKGIAQAVQDGTLNIGELPGSSDEQIISALVALNGIGVWTAEMLMIFSLQRPNIVSWGDLAIRRGMMMLYGHKTLTRQQFDRYAKRYSPYGTVASLYLWEIAVGN